MNTIAVIGLGNFGTALARTWLTAGHTVTGWTVEQEVFECIRDTSVNEKYLPGLALGGLTVYQELAKAVENAEVVALALPSGVVLKVVDELIPLLEDNQILLDLAKGLAEGEGLISTAIERKLLNSGKCNPVCVMMGATIAPELARGVYTTALVASNSGTLATKVAAALSTTTLKLSSASDPVGAEYWGAFKNIIAMACGVADGMKNTDAGGDNLKAAIFAVGFAEAALLLPKLGADFQTAFTAAGIGDLFVTSISPHGRNREMGERLGRGESLEDAQDRMVMVSEGVRATRMFREKFSTAGVNAPFVDTVGELLDGNVTAKQFVTAVLA